jgi:hypothetical protein
MQPIHTFTHATSLQEICSNKRFASTRKPCTTEIYNEFSSSFVQGFHDIPHANIHSCIASRGACTPFVANTPGLATHTAAQTANFSQTGLVTFDTKVKLPKGQYKIIAHIRFFTEAITAGIPSTKWDVAIGTAREIVEDGGGVWFANSFPVLPSSECAA